MEEKKLYNSHWFTNEFTTINMSNTIQYKTSQNPCHANTYFRIL